MHLPSNIETTAKEGGQAGPGGPWVKQPATSSVLGYVLFKCEDSAWGITTSRKLSWTPLTNWHWFKCPLSVFLDCIPTFTFIQWPQWSVYGSVSCRTGVLFGLSLDSQGWVGAGLLVASIACWVNTFWEWAWLCGRSWSPPPGTSLMGKLGNSVTNQRYPSWGFS